MFDTTSILSREIGVRIMNGSEYSSDGSAGFEDILVTPETINSLVAELGDGDGLVRERARLTLVYIGEPAVASLIEALTDSRQSVRWEAAKALSDIADPAAAPALVVALEDRVFDIRWLAAKGLIAIGYKSIVPLLKALIGRPDSVWLRQGAHHVLKELVAGELEHVLNPVITALEGPESAVEVPVIAGVVLNMLRESDEQLL